MIKSRFINILPTVVCCILFLVLGYNNAAAVNPPGTNCHCVIIISGSNSCDGVKSGKATATAYDGTAPYTYRWSNGATGATITGLASGTYRVTSTDKHGCTATQSVTISSVNVSVNAGPDKTICKGSSTQLSASGASIYSWSPTTGLSNPSIANPVASPTVTTTYTVTGGVPSGELVTNGNFEAGNTGFTSQYDYHTNLVPEGRYYVGTNANTYHSNFFGTGRGGSGRFMIINGATVAGVEVWRQNVNVNPNTTYYFSTWITALNNLVSANLAFSVNGVLMGPVISSPSSPNNWVQFYAVWNSGSATTARISIVNQNTIANGNDFGLDDISFTTVCEDTDKVVVYVNRADANAGPDQTLCEGLPATLTATGGGTYKWSTGATTASITVTSNTTQTYTVTVTNNGCTDTDDVKVNRVKSSLGVKGTITQPTCTSITGSITLAPYGGTTPYTYSWSNGATTKDISNLSAGTYTVTVTDKNGCRATYSGTIVVPAAFTVSATGTNPNCSTGATGSITATVNGGQSPYTYRWSNGATTQNLTNVAAGTYTLTVTDARGCTATVSRTLTAPAALSLSIGGTNYTCLGTCTGTATLTVSGGTSPYTYAWSNGATSQSLSNLCAGTFTVTVTDKNGCTANKSVTIASGSALTIVCNSTNVTTQGASNGKASVNVTGGVPPYSYSWSTGHSTQSVSNLPAGVYTVTVTDSYGCAYDYECTISQSAICDGFRTQTQGGWGAVPAGGNPGSYLHSNFASAFPSGVTVGCATGFTLRLTTAQAVTDFLPSGSTPTALTSNLVNPGGSYNNVFAGQVVALSISVGFDNAISSFGPNTTPLQDLVVVSGTFMNWTVSQVLAEANRKLGGCASSYSFSQLNEVVTKINESYVDGRSTGNFLKCGMDLTKVVVDVVCAGQSTGSVDLTVTGGLPPYTYRWSNGATTQDLISVPVGTYSVTVTDANGLTATTSAIVAQSPALVLNATGTNIACAGVCNGTATVAVTGGNPPYTYAWSNGSTTQSLSNICAGAYIVTITDSKGCIGKDTVSINANPRPVITATPSHVNCFGGATGSVTTTVTGGTTPYTYSWTPGGATTANLTNVAAGTYTVILTDKNGCKDTASATVTQPASELAATIASSPVSCIGGTDGTATVTPSGGTAPYTYSWSNGRTTAAITGLGVGSYSVTVTDAKGCTTNKTVQVTGVPALTLGSVPSPVLCNGGNTGAINLIVNGGTPPYTFRWSNGATTEDISGLTAGTYNVTVTDSKGCVATAGVSVSQPQPISATATPTHINCYGGSTGKVTLAVSGGTSPYTYRWNTNATTKDITNVAAGTYTVTITDANNCTATANATVNQKDSIKITTNPTHVSCNGQANGAISTTVSGGTAPYTYLWSNGKTTANISNLTAGVYILTVTDANGCKGIDTTGIVQRDSINIIVDTIIHNKCYGDSSGSATIRIVGGTPTCTPGSYTGPACTGCTMTLSGNTQNVFITAGVKACVLAGQTFTGSVNMSGGELIICGVFSPSNFSTTGGTINVNGTLNANVINLSSGVTINNYGTINVTTNITGSGTLNNYGNIAVSADLDINTGGKLNNYGTISVSNSLNVSGTALNNGTISISNNLQVNGGSTLTNNCKITVSKNFLNSNLVYNNGQILVGATSYINGGSFLNLGVGASLITGNIHVNGTINGPATSCALVKISGLAIFNSGGLLDGKISLCILNQLLNLNLNLNILGLNINTSCSCNATPPSSNSSYTIRWSTGDTTRTVSGLPAGTYTVTVTDASGCSATKSVTVTQPDSLTATINKTDVSCAANCDGTASLTNVGGGTPPYTYKWSNNATTQNVTGLCGGTYTVTITDKNGCKLTKSVTVGARPKLKVTATPTPVNCFAGSTGGVTTNVTGGTAPFTYAWTPGGATTANLTNRLAGSYTVIVTDANGCKDTATAVITQPADSLNGTTNSTPVSCIGGTDGTATITASGGTAPYTYVWSTTPARTTATITGLRVGSYTVTVTDAKGCTIVRTVNVTGVPPLTIGSVPSPVLCHGGNTGSINLTISGGTPGYTFLWSNGATTEDISGLAAGTYNVTVTDSKGCVATAGVSVTQPQPLVATATPVNIACFGGNTGGVNVTVVGGTSPFTYAWSNGATTRDITGLTAGTYTVTVTDKNGCKDIVSATVTQQPSLVVNATPTHVTCFGLNNGSVTTSVNGGVAPYTYNWGGGITTANRSNLTPGTYTVTVTDANGCTGTANATVTQPADSLNGIISSTPVSCIGGTDGTATVVASGGTAPYTYTWNTTPARTTAAITGLRAGSYSVTITDAKGCTVVRTVVVTTVPALTVGAVPSPVLCFGGATGSVNATVSGGTPGYTFLWSNGAVTEDIGNVPAGTYSLTVTDSKGCVATASVNVQQPQALKATATPTTIPCLGANSGSISVSVIGGTTPFTYAWSNGVTTRDLSGLSAGTYTLTVTDKNGCKDTVSATVTAQPTLAVNVTGTNLGCYNNNGGSATANVTGGLAPYTYVWNTTPARTTQTINGLSIGTYAVTVTDANGCTATGNVALTQPDSLEALASCGALLCYGDQNSNITLLVMGGTAPYTYLWSTGATTRDLSNMGAGVYTVTITDAKGCTVVETATVTQPAELVATATPLHIACNGAATGGVDLSVVGGKTPYTFIWSNGATTEDISGLTAGTYSVTVTDKNGCKDTVSVTINQQSQLQITATPTHIPCFGQNNGSITTSVNGGVAPYTYNWGVGQPTTANRSNLAPGTYTVTVTDANNCTGTATATVTQPADSLNGITNSTPVSCIGGTDGTASVVASGGTAPYTYVWSTTPARTTASITGLRVGSYTVTITDAKGCTVVRTVQVTGVPPLTIGSVPSPVLCHGGNTGSINLTISGGTPGYTFLWSNGATTEDISGLVAGTYNVTVTDSKGCVATAGVVVQQPQPLAATATPQHIACFGGNTGGVTLSVSGGTTPFTYVWSNGAVTRDITGLAAGTYTVTVTDRNGCTATASATVTQQAALQVTATPTDVTCFGLNNGSITTSVNGGVAPYTYNWGGGITTANRSNLAPGTYNVTVTDANGCTGTATATITQPSAALTASAVKTDVNCYGQSTGTVTLTVSGGTTAYSFLWSNGATTQNLTALAAGTYTVTVTDAKGCTTTASATITQPNAALAASAVKTDVNCYGESTGTVTLTVSGGTTVYTFLWSNGAATQNLTALAAGTYTVTVTDAKGCTTTASATITQPNAALAASAVKTDVSCYGQSTGTVTLTVSGGTTAYSYLWSNGATTQNLTGLAAGTYTVTVTDAKQCTATATATVTQPADSLNGTTNSTPVSCIGGTDGTASVTASGGTAPYTYVWSTTPARTTATITGLRVGSYTVTITDAKGCTIVRTVTVTGVPALTLGGVPSPVLCNGGNTGSINLTVSGGTPGYTFLWSSGATTKDISGLTAGNYNVTVTDSKGCIATAGFTVQQPQPLAATATPQHIACFGGNTGGVTLSVSGGTTPFTYLWSNGAVTRDITGLAAGTYTVTVTDKNGCTATANATVTQQAALQVNVTGSNLGCYANNSGAATANVTGGLAPYTYAWNTTPARTTQTINGLSIGTYAVTVTDANGCTGTGSVVLTQPDSLEALASCNALACYGDSTNITLLVIGGTQPYTYLWSNGATTRNLNNQVAGTYTVTVTDANGCTITASATVSQPDLLVATATPLHIACNGAATGGVSLTVVGGTAPYIYLWSNGAVTQNLSGLTAGTYTVTVTDAKGCKDNVSVTINQQSALQVTATPTHIPCFGQNNGSITTSVNGGVAPYTYNWGGGIATANRSNLAPGTYTVTVTDANNCTGTATATVTQPVDSLNGITNSTPVSCIGGTDGTASVVASGGTAPYTYVWSTTPARTTATITGLRVGSYTVTITDAQGCTVVRTVQVTGVPPLTIGAVPSPVLCHGGNTGSINLTISGGTPGYTFVWSNGATTEDISGLVAGTYNVTVTDRNGCVATSGVTVQQPQPLAATATPQHIACFGATNGGVSLGVVGGTTPFTYAWSNGAVTQNITGVAAGAYTVTVTDRNGCTATASATVTQQAALQVSVTPTHLTCNGNGSGKVSATVNGGVVPYTYRWNTNATGANLDNLPIGTYSVTVTDANGCTGTGSVTLTQPDVLTANATGSALLCFGNQNGTVTLTVSGGTTAYTYLWSNGATTQNLSGVVAGTYTVTITDANGCIATASAAVTQPASLTASATGSALLCFGNQNGTATLTVAGGTAPFTYAWSNGAATQNLSGLAAGTYGVTVTDANGCTAIGSATVTQPALLAVSGNNTNVLCNGGDNADITLTVVGGTAPYTYAWSNGASTQNLADLTAGTYGVTLTDANGCTDTKSFTIAEPAVLTASATPQHVRCFLGADGSITVTVSGGTAPYTYRWNTNATTQNLTALRAGTYTVTVTDANDCSTIVTTTVTQPGPLTLGGVPAPVSCSGGSNGSINLTVTGGVAPYVYAWSNGATTEDISGLVAGTYNVTVTDAHNCVATVAVTVQQPQPVSLSFVTTNVTTNGGSNGAIDLSVIGGTSPFTYVWSNGATTQDLNNIPAGTYCVTVTDVNGCTATDCRTITEPACTGFAASVAGTNVNCNGGNNGTATVTITGGVAPYTFNWGGGVTTQNRTGLAAGTYIVTITDAVNCSATGSVTITQPATLTAGAVGTNPACNGQSNGSVTLTVNGGTAPYTYAWSNGATTQNLTGLAGSAYTVTVTDANGCTATATATLTTPAALAISNQVTNVRCFLEANGSITTTITGGTAPYTYRWSNNATTANITALRAGTYTVTVTDAKGCTATRTLTVTQPGPLTLGGVPTPVSCFGGNNGSIDLTVSGGTAPYRYAWSNGATIEDISGLAAGTYHVTVTDASNCLATVSVNVQQPAAIALSANVTDACAGGNSGAIQLNVVGGTSPFTYRWSNNATTKNIGSLAPGTYAVTVTDSKGCIATNSFNVGSNVNCRTMEFTVNVLLEGPFEQSTMKMHNKLRTQCNTVPLLQPYGGGAANRGTESVASLDNDVVDWVLVSFRTGTDRATEVHKVAALLTISGKVKTITGDTIFQLNSSPSDSLFVVVEHRNHMGVMTPVKMCPSHATNGVICVDFTRTQSYTSGTPATAGQKLLGTDSRGPIYGMHSGDGDGNFDINSSDFVPFGTDFNKFDIYSPGDFNMDCDCNSNDLPKWLDNFNQFSGVR